MPDPQEQAAKQLANIEEATGKTLADFEAAARAEGLEKHTPMLRFFKSTYKLGHGNANLLAHLVRAEMAGGPKPSDELLDTQYEGKKAALRPIYERLAAVALSQGDDARRVVQKTGVSFRRAKQFALVQAPSSKRIQLGLNLDETPDDERIVATKGMCTHRVDVTALEQVDAAMEAWIRAAYERAQ